MYQKCLMCQLLSDPKEKSLRTKPKPTITKAKNRMISSFGKTEKISRIASVRCVLCTRWVSGHQSHTLFHTFLAALNPLNPKVKIWTLFISYRSSGEKLIKYQANASRVIMSVILMTILFYKALISQGEIWYWSLLGLKGLNYFRVLIIAIRFVWGMVRTKAMLKSM